MNGKRAELTKPSGRLPIPRPVEGDVHVRRVRVEGIPDRGAVRLEGEARGDGLGVAARIVEGGIGADNEVAARLEGLVVGEGGGVPHGEASWVAVPCVTRGEGVADLDWMLLGRPRRCRRERNGTYGC